MKKALICSVDGFNDGRLVKRMKRVGFWFRGMDLKFHKHTETDVDELAMGDLRDQAFCRP